MRVRQVLSARLFSFVIAAGVAIASPAAAQEHDDAAIAAAFQAPIKIELRPVEFRERPTTEQRRPGALVPLYGSLIALQGLDMHSTRRGMSSGKTREANPLMGSVVNNGAAFFAVKSAATAGAIWCAEKLWKKHPKRAIVFTALLNATMAAVVTHNYRAAK